MPPGSHSHVQVAGRVRRQTPGRRTFKVGEGSSGTFFLHKDMGFRVLGGCKADSVGVSRKSLDRVSSLPYLVKTNPGQETAVHNAFCASSPPYSCCVFLTRLIYKWSSIKFRILDSSSQLNSVCLCLPHKSEFFPPIYGDPESQNTENIVIILF